jgi:type I restriction enzyme S subunit
MASEHGRRTVGDYFTLQRGTTYKSRLLGQLGPVLLGLATIQRNGGFRRDSIKTYGGDSARRLLVQPGELYLSLKDVTQSADLLGAVARMPLDLPPGRLTQDTVRLEPRGANVPLGFLYWLLRTPQYRSYCRAHATGTTNLGLAREDLLAFPVPEPTPARLRVADTLEKLEDKIELNRRMNETLEAFARALFKSWFVDFDPVRAKSEGRDPGLPPLLADLFPDSFEDSALGEIPNGWEVGTFGDIASQWTERLRRREAVVLSAVATGELARSDEHFTKRVYSKEIDKYLVVEQWDFAYNPSRINIGSIGMLNEPLLGAVSPIYVVLRPKAAYRWFLQFSLKRDHTKHWINTLASGSVRQSLSYADFASIPCVVPPEPVIQRFDHVWSALRAGTLSRSNESRTLVALCDALLAKLVFGELNVNDAERLVGEHA